MARAIRWWAVVLCVVGLCAGAPTASSAGAAPALFLTRSGPQLRLGASPWRFVGFDDSALTSMPGAYSCTTPLDTPTLDAILQRAAASGARVVRTWFFQSYYDLDANGAPTTPSFDAFDRVLTAAAQYGLKVIPVLVNEFPQCEPGTAPKTASFYSGGYLQAGYGYPLSFKTYAQAIASHYAQDPTIAFWEIGNELSGEGGGTCGGGTETAAAHSLRTFADAITSAIKTADPNHLVALGTAGTGQCGLAGRDYAYVDAGGVDICEYQDYGDPSHSIPVLDSGQLAQRIAQCRTLHKPLFVGAAGIHADVGDNGRPTGTISAATLAARAGFYAAKLTAAFRAGLDGYVLWELCAEASSSPYNLPSGGYEIGPGDPTLSVTTAISRTFGSYPGPVRSTFEDGRADGWIPVPDPGRPTVSNSTSEAWAGLHSLAITLSGSRAEAIRLANPRGLGSGSIVTLHVFVPETAPPGIAAAPYVIRRTATSLTATPAILVPGWNVITWRIPPGAPGPLAALGLTTDEATRWKGSLFLDDVAWSTVRSGH